MTRLLLADDDDDFRLLLRVRLGAIAGVTVVAEARDGAEAIELAQTTRPAVVLLDLQMPRIGGLEAAQAIRSAMPETLVLLQTGDVYSAVAARGRELGFGVLDKIEVMVKFATILQRRSPR